MMNLLCIKFDGAQIITIISVGIVIVGWFVNQWLNRRNEIKKEARTHRLEMLKSFMNLYRLMEEKNNFVRPSEPDEEGESEHIIPDDMELWAGVYVQMKLYGKKNEIKLYEEIKSALYNALFDPGLERLTNENFRKLRERCEELANLCTNSIRKELHLEK
ncbi:hypothetical protein FACS189464_2380 [Bacteroidia bacterium]|nr:hypothetical protein FACS189464_2380 [Bacteroidia bacterium]